MRFWRFCWHSLRFTVVLTGLLALLLLVLAFTPLPGRAYAWFAQDTYTLANSPEVIVVLGGGGIPSKSGLMRTYTAAEWGLKYPDAQLIASLPADDNTPEAETSVGLMKKELVMRGIPPKRIHLEKKALNTRQQAAFLYRDLTADGEHPDVLLVTSGYHLKRSLLTFRKAGFERVAGAPSRMQEVDTDFGPLVNLRYTFWQNLEHYVVMIRECIALGIYRLKGWI